VNEDNAHPLTGCDEHELAIVLNGIVENYRELKAELEAAGHVFSSQTDAEVVAHLIETVYEGDLVEAVRAVYGRLEGHFTFVVIHHDQPDRLVAVRCETPLVVGLGDERELPRLEPGRVPRRDAPRASIPRTARSSMTPSSVRIVRASDGSPVELDVQSRSTGTRRSPSARATRRSWRRRSTSSLRACARRSATASGTACSSQDGLGMTEDDMRELRRIVIVACGTAYHAGVVGRYVIEEWGARPGRARRRQRVDLPKSRARRGHARDRHLPVRRDARHDPGDAARPFARRAHRRDHEPDGLADHARGRFGALHAHRARGRRGRLQDVLGPGRADVPDRARARPQRGTLPAGEIEFILDQVWKLPAKMQAFLDADHPIDDIAERFYQSPFFLFLGRHIGLPVALEGALKLKEISYIPTEAYSAGEMKHGPIALLEEGTPVVVVATRMNTVYDKVVSNIQECRARGAHVIAIATEGNEDIQHHANDVIYVPKSPAFLQAALATLPLQLLAYKIARLRGLNVDQPRNLAKTVTVE
jgi:glucosamine--fructose-6-phosphate aminotransferase (isomerizing)